MDDTFSGFAENLVNRELQIQVKNPPGNQISFNTVMLGFIVRLCLEITA